MLAANLVDLRLNEEHKARLRREAAKALESERGNEVSDSEEDFMTSSSEEEENDDDDDDGTYSNYSVSTRTVFERLATMGRQNLQVLCLLGNLSTRCFFQSRMRFAGQRQR